MKWRSSASNDRPAAALRCRCCENTMVFPFMYRSTSPPRASVSDGAILTWQVVCHASAPSGRIFSSRVLSVGQRDRRCPPATFNRFPATTGSPRARHCSPDRSRCAGPSPAHCAWCLKTERRRYRLPTEPAAVRSVPPFAGHHRRPSRRVSVGWIDRRVRRQAYLRRN
jgi:hypothetical protein